MATTNPVPLCQNTDNPVNTGASIFTRASSPIPVVPEMSVAIVGSRDFPNLGLVRTIVRALPAGTRVISGGARGVDSVAEVTARERGLEIRIFPADWARYGRSAGPLRNAHIVRHADQILAFWTGKSRGTLDTLRQARDAGKMTWVINPDGSFRTFS